MQSSHPAGVSFSTKIWFIRSVTMSTPTSPGDITIPFRRTNGLVASIPHLYDRLTNQVIFLSYITYCRHFLFISYTLFNNDILVSFDLSLCNAKHFTFLPISLTNTFRYFSVSFTFRLINSSPSLYLYFRVSLLICVSLFILFLKFPLPSNTVLT